MSSSRNHSEIAARFEADVLIGAFLTGALFRAAVERQIRDHASPPEGYRWSDEEADKACEFAEYLAFPKGPKRGERFRLEPWQEPFAALRALREGEVLGEFARF